MLGGTGGRGMVVDRYTAFPEHDRTFGADSGNLDRHRAPT
jgi:hypothetical protein